MFTTQLQAQYDIEGRCWELIIVDSKNKNPYTISQLVVINSCGNLIDKRTSFFFFNYPNWIFNIYRCAPNFQYILCNKNF